MNRRLLLTRLMLLALVPLFLFSHHIHRESGGIDVLITGAGLALLVAASAGRIWASLYLAGRRNRELVTHGPYSIVRNPLYLFSLVGFVGAGLAFGSLVLAAALAGVFAIGHWPEIRREEELLSNLFGEEYERYRREVPAIVPARLRGTTSPESLVVRPGLFCPALRDASLIPMVLVVAELLEWVKLSGILPILIELH